MKLNRKLWTAALAVAMTTPSAMAAQDTAGMHYTSAAEGFYASIRLRYVSNGGSKDGGADLQNSSSRFGVRGTNDLGGGLEGFYQYEAGVETENSGGLSTRLGLVGLRGDFGSVVAGSFWTDTYNWVYGSTDIANRHSGQFGYGEFGQGRSKNSLQYTTPDLNGFQGAILIKADSSSDGEGAVTPDTDATGQDTRTEYEVDNGIRVSTLTIEVPPKAAKKGNKDDNDIDHWSIVAKYEIAGFSMGASYSNSPDAMVGELEGAGKRAKDFAILQAHAEAVSDPAYAAALDAASGTRTRAQYLNDIVKVTHDKEDLTSWAVKLGYSQDNWYVNGWYGEINHSDGKSSADITFPAPTTSEPNRVGFSRVSYVPQDTQVFSLAGGVSVDKVSVYAVYENKENQYALDDSYTTLGVQYTLGSNSWTWVEYAGRDLDSSDSEDSDFSIGLGHSF